jgi:hypothetical protein
MNRNQKMPRHKTSQPNAKLGLIDRIESQQDPILLIEISSVKLLDTHMSHSITKQDNQEKTIERKSPQAFNLEAS